LAHGIFEVIDLMQNIINETRKQTLNGDKQPEEVSASPAV
jgi:hypothetical protein